MSSPSGPSARGDGEGAARTWRARARSLSRPVRQLGGFGASAALGTVIGVFSIPLLVGALGPAEWGKIAVIQTTGQMAAVLVMYGWGATGPAMIASTPPTERAHAYHQSWRTRGLLYLAVAPFTALALFFLLHGDLLLAVLGAYAYLVPALGAGWFFTGVAQPVRLFLLDSLPTALGTVAGIVAAVITRETWVVPVAQLLGSATAVLTARAVILRRHDATKWPTPSVRANLRTQRHAVATAGTSALYVGLPVLSVSLFFPAALPTYVMADRLFRYASLAFLPFQQYFQGWVPAIRDQLASRCIKATAAATAIGTVGGTCIALLSPIFAPVLGTGEIEVPLSVSIPLGLAFVGVATSAVAGYAGLVAVGRTATLARSTIIGAIAGAPLVVVAAVAHSLPLVAIGVAVTELLVAGYQVAVLMRVLRERAGTSD